MVWRKGSDYRQFMPDRLNCSTHVHRVRVLSLLAKKMTTKKFWLFVESSG